MSPYGFVLAALLRGLVFILRKTRPARPEQMTFCYCPGCHNELCSDPQTIWSDTDYVRYTCGKCGLNSVWMFDAPVPILLSPKVPT